jgi:3-methyladenine DNA glycosylase AlkD
MTDELTAARYVERLTTMRSDEELAKIQRYFKTGDGDYGAGDVFLGVRMGDVFALSKELVDLPPDQIELLLENELHEVRAGGCSVMAKQAARKKTTDERRTELYDLYLRRLDRINNWDLVDLAARDVIGAHLIDRPRDPLYDLARSPDHWARRTSIYATYAFIRIGQLDDTFSLAAILLDDPEDLMHKAVGGWLREAGKHDLARLLAFLDQHAAAMPRTTLRYATEKLTADQKAHYRALR